MNHPEMNVETVRAYLLQERLRRQKESAMTAESRGTVVLDQTSVGRLLRMDAMQSQAMAEAAERRRTVGI